MENKELDLLDIIKICWNLLVKYIFTPIALIIKLGFKRWYILLVAVILGISLSVIMPCVFVKKNKSEIIIKNNVGGNPVIIKEIEVLASLNRDRLSELIEIDKETLKNLVAIKPHKIISKDSTFATYKVDSKDSFGEYSEEYKVNPNLFALEVLSKDTSYLSVFTDAVLKYINEKSSFATINERRLSVMRSELKTFKDEVKVLDSLRYISYFTNEANKVVLGTSGETFSINDKNQWIQNDLMLLKSKVINLEQILKNDTLAVEQVTTLSISDIYENHPLKTAPKYAIVFFLLSYVMVICLEYKKNILDWIKK